MKSVQLTEDFIPETDHMCNLRYNNKLIRTSDDYKQDVYYETAYDADDDDDNDDDDDDYDYNYDDDDSDDDDDGDVKDEHGKAFILLSKRRTLLKLHFVNALMSPLSRSNNGWTIKDACYHQTLLNLEINLPE